MENIATIRAELGVTQSQLADMIGLHQSTISRLESGDLVMDKRTAMALEMLLKKPRRKQKAA